MTSTPAPIPVTILTGFLGSGKTTLLLSLLPQLPPNYRLCLLKNELGDVAVDSQLATQNSVAGVTELTNGCICCNLVGQLSDALVNLKDTYHPARIVIETSGAAFPATLAMEVNRLAATHPFTLDGVIQVIDAENWPGFSDTSYAAKMQAAYTDLIVLNKHELAGADKTSLALDRIRDVADETPVVRTTHGSLAADLVFGLDGSLARNFTGAPAPRDAAVDVLSVTLRDTRYVDGAALRDLLASAPKDEVFRIKGIVRIPAAAVPHDDRAPPATPPAGDAWILNWAFGRWTCTPLRECSVSTHIESPPTPEGGEDGGMGVRVETCIRTTVEEGRGEAAARLNFVLAAGEGKRWKRRLEMGRLVRGEEKAGVVAVETLA